MKIKDLPKSDRPQNKIQEVINRGQKIKMKMKMNSNLTLVPLEKKEADTFSLIGFITPSSRAKLAMGQANEKNQTKQHSNILKNVRMF